MQYIKKMILGIIFILCSTSLFLYSEQFKSTIKRVNNNSTYDIKIMDATGLILGTISPGGAYTQDKILPEAPQSFSIDGIGKGEMNFSTGQVVNLAPLNGKGFGWLDEEFANAQVTVVFQAKTDSGDIQVAIGKDFSVDPEYKVIIGGQNNSRSSIMKKGVETAFITREDNPGAMAGILATQEAAAYPQYWICYDKGLILVGKGRAGENVFLSWRDPEGDLYVKRIGFGSNQKEISYTNIILLPSLITVPPSQVYETIISKDKKGKEELDESDMGVAKEARSDSAKTEKRLNENEIKFGGIIKLKNINNNKQLQENGGKVVCDASGCYWLIKVPNQPLSYKFGESIKNGSSIVLEALDLSKNLSVQAAGVGLSEKYSEADSLKLEIEEAFWKKDTKIRLSNAGKNLLVTASGDINFGKGAGDLWAVESYEPPVTKDILPTGSIIALKSTKNNEYIAVRPGGVGGTLRYGDKVVLRNVQFVKTDKSSQPVEKKYYLAVSPSGLEVNPNPSGTLGEWMLSGADGKEIKYGDAVTLVATDGKPLLPKGLKGTDAEKWLILDPNNPLNRNVIIKGGAVAFQSVSKSYIGGTSDGKVIFGSYVTDNEKWIIEKIGEEDITVPLVFANGKNTDDLNTLFRVIRSGNWIGLQSLTYNQNLEAVKKLNWEARISDSDFYGRKNTNLAGHFLIRKVGEDFFLYSRLTESLLQTQDENKPLAFQMSGVKYTDSAKFKLEVFGKPTIEIINATYASVSNPDQLYDVTENLQSLVDVNKLIIPAGREVKNLIFGDPVPNVPKQLAFTFAYDGKEFTKKILDKDAFFIGLTREFKDRRAIDMTLMNGEYFWIKDSPLRIPGQGAIIFEANAIDEIYVALCAEAKKVYGTNQPLYEFVIGAENNSKTLLNKQSQKIKLAAVSTPKIVSQNKFAKYWISVNSAGVILFGKGDLGQNLLLAFKDEKALKNVKYFGVSCGKKPVQIRNITFAPSVNLDVPANMTAEYEKKLLTYKESTRKIKIVSQFKYSFYIKGPQLLVANEAGREVPILEKQKMDEAFSVDIAADGSPSVSLQFAEKTASEKALRALSSVVSGVAEAAGQLPGTAGAIAGVAGAAISKSIEAGLDAAYSGPEDVRTEEYKAQQSKIIPNTKVQAYNKEIGVLEKNIKEFDPEADEDQFEAMVDSYREMLDLVVSSDNIDVDPRRKERIILDLKNLINIFNNKYQFAAKNKFAVKLCNKLIFMLLKAYNNPYLFGSEDVDIKSLIFARVNQMAQNMFENSNELEMPQLYGNYFWLKEKFDEDGNGAIRFKARAGRDIFVALSSEMGAVRDIIKEIPLYEVIIGRQNNTSIAFRLFNKGHLLNNAIKLAKDAPKAMPNLNEFKQYWISIKTFTPKKGERKMALLEMGINDFDKKNVILSWTDRYAFKDIIYLGFGSWGTTYDIRDIEVSQKSLGDTTVKWAPVFKGQAAPAPTKKKIEPVVEKKTSVEKEIPAKEVGKKEKTAEEIQAEIKKIQEEIAKKETEKK